MQHSGRSVRLPRWPLGSTHVDSCGECTVRLGAGQVDLVHQHGHDDVVGESKIDQSTRGTHAGYLFSRVALRPNRHGRIPPTPPSAAQVYHDRCRNPRTALTLDRFLTISWIQPTPPATDHSTTARNSESTVRDPRPQEPGPLRVRGSASVGTWWRQVRGTLTVQAGEWFGPNGERLPPIASAREGAGSSRT